MIGKFACFPERRISKNTVRSSVSPSILDSLDPDYWAITGYDPRSGEVCVDILSAGKIKHLIFYLPKY